MEVNKTMRVVVTHKFGDFDVAINYSYLLGSTPVEITAEGRKPEIIAPNEPLSPDAGATTITLKKTLAGYQTIVKGKSYDEGYALIGSLKPILEDMLINYENPVIPS
jgi:hypothetical protein